MRRVGFLVVALVLAGCGSNANVAPSASAAGPSIPQVTATAVPTPSAVAIANETALPTPTPVVAANCPTTAPLTVTQLVGSDPACFTGDIVVVAYLGRPPNIGLDPLPHIPAWLTDPADIKAAIWSARPDTVEDNNQCPGASPDCVWTFFHVAPDSGVTVDTTPRWVRVTGHLHDPAAATCNYDWANITPDNPFQPASSNPATVIANCDAAFVVTRIEDTAAP